MDRKRIAIEKNLVFFYLNVGFKNSMLLLFSRRKHFIRSKHFIRRRYLGVFTGS